MTHKSAGDVTKDDQKKDFDNVMMKDFGRTSF